MKNTVKTRPVLASRLLGCCVFCLVTPLWCSAAIIYSGVLGTPIPSPISTSLNDSIELDFNGDGIVDIEFLASRGDIALRVASDTSVLAIPAQGLDLGASVPKVHQDELIDGFPDFGGQVQWLSRAETPGQTEFMMLASCRVVGEQTLCLGQWADVGSGFVGVEFEIDDQIHYGWVQIDVPFSGVGYGVLVDYAFESESATGILAGAIPEPSTYALFVIGVAFIGLTFRSRNAKRA